MAIGMTPLIPLDRVVPVPDARLQRFGVNNSLLFGKPLVTFGGESLLASRPAAPAVRAETALKTASDEVPGPGKEQAGPVAAPALAAAYSSPKWTGAGALGGSAPAAGSLVDLKA